MLNFDKEYVYIIKKREKNLLEIVYQKQGTENEVSIAEYMDKNPDNSVNNQTLTLIHTHTNNTAFSVADYKVFLKHKSFKRMMVFNAIGRCYSVQRNNSSLLYYSTLPERLDSILNDLEDLYNVLGDKLYHTLPENCKIKIRYDKNIQSNFLIRLTKEFFIEVCKYLELDYYPKEVYSNV